MTTDSQATTALVGNGPVTLVLPPDASMVRVGRLTASSVASLTNMSIDAINDIKIAVSEMITLLIESGQRSNVTLRFEATASSFVVEASTPAASFDLGRNDLALATAVLDAVCDSNEIAFHDDRILVRCVKANEAVSASSGPVVSPNRI